MEMWCYSSFEDKYKTRLVQLGFFVVEEEEGGSEDSAGEVTDEADIAGESDGDIDEEEHHGTAVFGVVAGLEFEGDVGEDRHGESTDPDGIRTREEEESYPDEDGIAEEKEDIFGSSDQWFDLISEYKEEETVHDEVEDATVEELVEEKLNYNACIIPLHQEEWVHPIIQDRRQKERNRRHDTTCEDEEIRDGFIVHTFGFWKRKRKRLRRQSSGCSGVAPWLYLRRGTRSQHPGVSRTR